MKCCSFLINLLTTKAHIDYDLKFIKYINNSYIAKLFHSFFLSFSHKCNVNYLSIPLQKKN